MVSMYADPALPGGCLIINGASDCSNAGTPAAVRAALQQAVQSCESLLLARLQRAQRQGQLAPNARVKELAVFFAALLAGLSLLAKSGATRPKLEQGVRAAMGSWPAPSV